MERVDSKKFNNNKKFKVKDFTGCILLLLNKYIIKGKINLNSLYFKAISKDAITFKLDI